MLAALGKPVVPDVKINSARSSTVRSGRSAADKGAPSKARTASSRRGGHPPLPSPASGGGGKGGNSPGSQIRRAVVRLGFHDDQATARMPAPLAELGAKPLHQQSSSRA